MASLLFSPFFGPVVMEVTAYTLDPRECGKLPSDPWYGITASGKRVQEGVTVAAGKGIPFGGTVVLIEGLGFRIVQDRGGMIKDHNLDVYMEEALKFGRRELKVYILNKEYIERG